MKAQHILAFVAALAISVVLSCEPLEKASEVPEINFKKFSPLYVISQNDVQFYAVDLTFGFKDGDSDIGILRGENDEDTVNLVLMPYSKINGQYDSIDADLYGRKYTIYYDEKLDRSSTIRGEIKVQIQYFILPPFDTLRYDFYIKDRAGHTSNIESTTDIGF